MEALGSLWGAWTCSFELEVLLRAAGVQGKLVSAAMRSLCGKTQRLTPLLFTRHVEHLEGSLPPEQSPCQVLPKVGDPTRTHAVIRGSGAWAQPHH